MLNDVTPSYYKYNFNGVKLDPYRILKVYNITHPAHQHALKKLLRIGNAHKDTIQDIQETIDSLTRWLEMLQEEDTIRQHHEASI